MNGQRMFVNMLIGVLLLVLAVEPVDAPRAPDRVSLTRPSPAKAIAAAMNDLESIADGYRLHHPHYIVTFTPDGPEFRSQGDGPTWAWHLTAVTAGDSPLAGVETSAVRPAHEQPLTVVYPRGGLAEQYLAKKNTIEQQFFIPQPLLLGGADLVIAGAVRSTGNFEETEDGWRWHTSEGDVYLGHVHVYDARGVALPATMAVMAHTTRIVVAGDALAQAAYPVTVDPEIGYNFRLSSMGPFEDPDYDAEHPAVAYNSQDNEYLVVWEGDDDVNGEYEIWGQRVDATTGYQIDSDFKISSMGPTDDPDYDAYAPAVAYNSQTNEYLVVWEGEHYAVDEFEIWGRRVNASTGALIGSMARVSVMGPDVDPDYDARSPAVAYNSQDNEYLVVWEGDHHIVLVDGEFEIWGQLLTGSVEKIGDKFGLSDMGGEPGDPDYDAYNPDVAYDSIGNGYLVVWEGDNTGGLLENNEFEIWGQLLESDGHEVGTNDFRISAMGGTGDENYDAVDPAVAYDNADHQYLVVWESEGTYVDTLAIFGQRLNAYTGGELGEDDFFLCYVGNYDAINPAVAYDPYNNEYLVVWQGDELDVDEFEIWGQLVDAATGALSGSDTRLSYMGPEGNASYIAQTPAVAYSNVSNNEYLVAWSGDNSPDGEFEIWAQRFTGGYKVVLPLVLRND